MPDDPNFVGVFAIFTTRRPSPVWEVLRTDKNPTSFHLQRKTPHPWVKHYHFHIMDPDWGHIIICMSGHPTHHALIILNGHDYAARQAEQKGIQFTKEGNCFTSLSNSRQFAAVADTLRSPSAVGLLRQICDRWVYWCASFGVSFEEQKRTRFRYDYSFYQMEFSRNFLFRNGPQMERTFDGLIDRTRTLLDVKRVMKIFGCRHRRLRKRKEMYREQVILERPTYDLTVFKLLYGGITLKMYTKGECVLRTEVVVEKVDLLKSGRQLHDFNAIVNRLAELLETFLNHLQCVDLPWVKPDQLDAMALAGQVGETKTAGIDIGQPRVRAAIHGVLALSLKPGGFTSAEHAAKVNELTGGKLNYTPRQSAYDLKKLRGKELVTKTHPRGRRYQATKTGLRTMSGMIILRHQIIEPLLKYHGRAKSGPLPQDAVKIDRQFRKMQHLMTDIFREFHLIEEQSINRVLSMAMA